MLSTQAQNLLLEVRGQEKEREDHGNPGLTHPEAGGQLLRIPDLAGLQSLAPPMGQEQVPRGGRVRGFGDGLSRGGEAPFCEFLDPPGELLPQEDQIPRSRRLSEERLMLRLELR